MAAAQEQIAAQLLRRQPVGTLPPPVPPVARQRVSAEGWLLVETARYGQVMVFVPEVRGGRVEWVLYQPKEL